MLRTIARNLAGSLGFQLVGLGHIGVRVEEDLKRLTHQNPLATIFDVGANIGQTSVRFSKSFPNSVIYAFEPVWETYNRLQSAVRGLHNVRTFACGFGETSGTLEINVVENSQCSSLKPIPGVTQFQTVNIGTINGFCSANNISRIDVLKIDVEGFELEVLKGSRGMLDVGAIRFVYAECVFAPDSRNPHTSFFDLHKFLGEYGFLVFASYAEGFSLVDGSALANVLFVHRQHIPQTASGRVRNIA